VQALRRWYAAAAEVIVVDSESDDGTLEWLREHLDHPNVYFFTRPRGLYAAWNFGVQQCHSEYVYFATIGDEIGPGGVEKLLRVAEQFSADVVLSPPLIVDTSGVELTDVQWPVHKLLNRVQPTEAFLLSEWQSFGMANCFGNQGLLGSSASNLYRRQSLLDAPFPEDFGHAGDSMWGRLYSANLRAAVLPEAIARFVVEDRNLKFGRLTDNDFAQQVLLLEVAALHALERDGRHLRSDMKFVQEGKAGFAAWVAEKTGQLEHIKKTCAERLAYIGDLKLDGEARLDVMETLSAEVHCLQKQLAALQKEKSRPKLLRERIASLFSR